MAFMSVSPWRTTRPRRAGSGTGQPVQLTGQPRGLAGHDILRGAGDSDDRYPWGALLQIDEVSGGEAAGMLTVDHERRVLQSCQFLPEGHVVEMRIHGAVQVPDMVPPFPRTVRVLDELAVDLPVQDRFPPSGVPGGQPGHRLVRAAEALGAGAGTGFLAMRGRAGQRIDQRNQ